MEIFNSKYGTSVSGTESGDIINNNGSNVTVTSGGGDDSIYNYANQVTINAGADDDTITNISANVSVDAGAGNDFINSNGYADTLNGGAGNDYIFVPNYGNDGKNTKIIGGDGDDTIHNLGVGGVTIDAGDGNDSIMSYNNWYNTTSISAGAGNDTIKVANNAGNLYTATINAGTGDDLVSLASNATKDVIEYKEGDGSDIIYGFNANTTLKLLSGSISRSQWLNSDLFLTIGQDTITLVGVDHVYTLNIVDDNNISVSLPGTKDEGAFEYSSIKGSENDNITITSSKVKVLTDGGNDTVYDYGGHTNNYVDTGDDNDTLYYYSSNSTIYTGFGNDRAYMTSNAEKNNYVDLGDGDDYLSNNGPNTTILGGAGNDTIYTCSNTTQNIIDGGEGDDKISFAGRQSTVYGGGGRDSLYSHNVSVVSDGGEGNDTLRNYYGSNSTLIGGEGNDTIYNQYSDDVIILGNKGDDTITNTTSNAVSIDGGEGNDLIHITNYSNDTTVKVGEGNDTIVLGTGVTSLTVEEFSAGDMIILAQEVNGLITTDDGIQAGDVNISGLNGTIQSAGWELVDNVASYVDTKSSDVVLLDDRKTIVYGNGKAKDRTTLVTVNGVVSIEDLEIDTENKVVTVPLSSLSQDMTVTISDDYKLALGADVPQPEEYETEGWRINGNIATYKDNSTTEGYVLENNQIVYHTEGKGKALVTVKGVTSLDGLVLNKDNKVVTVSLASLSKDEIVTISGEYTLAKGTDVPGLETETFNGWRYDASTQIATYVDEANTQGFVLSDDAKQISYFFEGKLDNLVTVTGVSSEEGLQVNFDTNVVTVSRASLDPGEIVSVSEGFTLELGDVDLPEWDEPIWDYKEGTAFGRVEAKKGGYKLENNQISYVQEGESNTLAVYGLDDHGTFEPGKTLRFEDKVVTVDYTALNGFDNGPVRVTPGYTLKMADNVNQPIIQDEQWSYNENSKDAIYSSASRDGGYSLRNNQILFMSYRPSDEATITGVTGYEGIGVDDDTFTIPNKVLNKSTVTITEGYKLALADDVQTPTRTSNRGWRFEEGKATYNTGSMTDGYRLDGEDEEGKEKISYVEEQGNEVLLEVDGIRNADGLFLDEKENIVTVYNSALNQKAITIKTLVQSDEGEDPISYKLELGDDDKGRHSRQGWEYEGTTAQYREDAWTEGYTVEDGGLSISYTEAYDGEITLKLKGVDASQDFKLNDPNEIEDGDADADSDSKVAPKLVQLISNNFTEEGITVEENTRAYKFEITDDAESFTADTKFTGSANKDVLTNHGNNLIIDMGAGADRVTNEGATVAINAGKGNDKIDNSGTGVTITGGAGNDNVTLSSDTEGGENTFVYSDGDGKDNIINFGAKDKIKIADDSAIEEAIVKGDDVEFKIGQGSITLKDGATTNRRVTIVGANGNEIASISGNIYTHDGVITTTQNDETKMILSTTFNGIYTASEAITEIKNVSIVDGSNLERGASIHGGTDAGTLIGGVGKDTLINGVTDGFELTGGKGNDLFVYTGGKGTIKDYSQKGSDGKDKISLAEGFVFTDYAVNGNNVILSASENDSLILEGAVGKEITFGTSQTTVNVYKDDGIFESSGKSATLATATESFSATKNYSKLVTIDGKLISQQAEIIGNKKANLIIAGKAGATLNGGKGNDTLTGGDGDDVFVFDAKSGNKLIKNFGNGDKLALGKNASISEVKASGDNLEIKIGNNKITIEGGKGSDLIFDDGTEKTLTADGFVLSENDDKSVSVSLTGNSVSTIDLSDSAYDDTKYKDVSAELLKKVVSITGDNDDNVLTGGKGSDTLDGGSGDDTLWGGKGNDELIGGEGKDTFIFYAGGGTDTIKDFNIGGELDELVIVDKRGNRSGFSKAVFGGDKLTLSIKGGGKVILENVTANSTFNINNETYSVVGKTIK